MLLSIPVECDWEERGRENAFDIQMRSCLELEESLGLFGSDLSSGIA